MTRGWRATAIALASSLLMACGSPPSRTEMAHLPQEAPDTEDAEMIVTLTAHDRVLTVRLDDSPAARDFVALLPLELVLSDYNQTEKIADLPASLSREGSARGVAPMAGDLAYYAPWGNLAIFYKDFRHSPGLIRLGRIEGDSAEISSLEGRVRIALRGHP